MMTKSVWAAVLTGAIIVGSNSSAVACACCGTWKVTRVPANDVLNIRSGPGVHHRKVGAIPSGSACVVKTGECAGNWCKISYVEYRGWVSTRYLRYFKSP